MKERPILFSGPMVRSILDGRKTQTRRPIKPQPIPFGLDNRPWMPVGGVHQDRWLCPLGQPGDRLWVRETWAVNGSESDDSQNAIYAADGYGNAKWRPSIHMPRWASRITLEVTRVWVERVQDVTDYDAFLDGCTLKPGTITGPYCTSYKEGFRDTWQSIYGTWDVNPWVWAIEFRRVKP